MRLSQKEKVKIQPELPKTSYTKEEEYLRLKKILDQEKAEFKKRTRSIEARLEELGNQLRAEAKAAGVTSLNLIEFRPRTRRRVIAKRFMNFMNKLGKLDRFFEIVDVPVTKAVEVCGEEPLRDAGVLIYESDPYAIIAEK